MAYRSSSSSIGSATVAVPAGAATDDIAIIVITIDNTAAVVEASDWPTGFVELAQTDLTLDGQTAAVGWKRLTGADAGNYTFGAVGATVGLIHCALFSGRHTTDPPVISATATSNAANTTPVSIAANGVTAVAGDDLVWISAPDVSATGIGNGHTAPSGYTSRQDTESGFNDLCTATQDNVGAGATGTQTGSFALTGGTSGWAAWTVRIPAAGGAVASGAAVASGVGVGQPVAALTLAATAQAIATGTAQIFGSAEAGSIVSSAAFGVAVGYGVLSPSVIQSAAALATAESIYQAVAALTAQAKAEAIAAGVAQPSAMVILAADARAVATALATFASGPAGPLIGTRVIVVDLAGRTIEVDLSSRNVLVDGADRTVH